MTSNIAKRYSFKDEVIRRTANVDFVTHLERGLEGRGVPREVSIISATN